MTRGTGYGPLSELASGHFGAGANYDDDHVPAPSPHVPSTYAFQASGSAHHPPRFVVGENDSIGRCMVSGAWIASDTVLEVVR